jgi:hypothetical protein
LLEEVAKKAKGRIGQQDAAYKEWVCPGCLAWIASCLTPRPSVTCQIPRLLQFAEASSTHWRYKLIATRFLRQLIRRDQVRHIATLMSSSGSDLHTRQPLMSELASYMARQAISTIPDVRVYCLKACVSPIYGQLHLAGPYSYQHFESASLR